jgi:hypothetical protein
MNWWYYTGAVYFSEDRTDSIVARATQQLDDLSLEQLLDEWNDSVKEGLGHAHTPDWVMAQESAKIYRWRMTTSFAVGIVALVVAIGAVFTGRGR